MKDIIYKVDNEIVAILLAILSIYYLNKILLKEMRILKTIKTIFAGSILFAIADITMAFIENLYVVQGDNITMIVHFAVAIRIVANTLITVQWIYLTTLYAERTKIITKKKHLAIWAPFSAVILMLCINPFISLVYNCNIVNNRIVVEFGPLNTVINIIIITYFGYVATYLWRKRQHLSRRDLMLFTGLAFSYLIVVIAESFVEGWLIGVSTTVLCMFVGLAHLKDDFMRLNLEDGTLKRSMLEYYFNKELQKGKKDLAIAYLILKDSQYIENKFGKREKNKYELDFVKLLGENELYEVSGYGYGRMVLYLKTSNREIIRKILEEIECRVNIFNNKDFKDRKYTINYESAVAVYDEKYNNCKDVIESAYKEVYLKVYGGEQ